MRSATKPSILVVEDSAWIQAILERRFLPAFSPLFASGLVSARALLKLLSEHGPRIHLVLSDYELLSGNGYEVLEQARRRFPETPRLLMCASTPPRLEEQIASGVVTRFLRKPIRLADLLAG